MSSATETGATFTASHAAPLPADLEGIRAYVRDTRRRVPLRAVRRHAREAEREARTRRASRRPLRGRRRVRRLRRGQRRPAPQRSRSRSHARRAELHAAAVAAERRPHRLRPACGGPAVALLPAHHPAAAARARAGARLRVQDRRRARVLPAAASRGRRPGAGGCARRPRAAVLRHARADAQPRLRQRRRAPPQRARVGQLRHRPRGRQRPVRAELRVRGRADDMRPRDLLPLHGGEPGAGARADRHVHAEAVRPSDRQRVPFPHEPVEGRRQRLRRARRRRPARHGPLARRLPLHRRSQGARQGVHRAHRAHGELVQAPGRRIEQRLHVGAGLRQLRQQQPHADAAHPRTRAHRGPHGRRLVQPLPRDGGHPGRGPRRHRARARARRSDLGPEPA